MVKGWEGVMLCYEKQNGDKFMKIPLHPLPYRIVCPPFYSQYEPQATTGYERSHAQILIRT